jgi:anti-repressor protein
MSDDLDLFATAGDGLSPEHFGIDDHGRAYVQAKPFSLAMDYSATSAALRILDEDDKGVQIMHTPGGPQSVAVIYEDGIWELIFVSRKPSAKAIKTKVKAILRQLRETGVVDTRERPMTELEMARGYVAALERIAELEPAAQSWTALADAAGDYAVADAAKILSRDPAINIGRDRLFDFLKGRGWVYRGEANRWRPYQRAIDCDRLAERLQSSLEADGSRANRAPQVRVTVKGIHELHRLLGGSGPLLLSA